VDGQRAVNVLDYVAAVPPARANRFTG
jgi:hypothetical protein